MSFESFASVITSCCAALAIGLPPAPELASRGSLQRVSHYGDNPAGVSMYAYVPKALECDPGIVVAIHYCHGSAEAYHEGQPYADFAEKYNFIVIYPDSPHIDGCWDVASRATLTNGGGGESNSIANMVSWTLANYGANAANVFVTGTSSGAMMTNVMAATYPGLFAAGIAYSGVPAGCFYSAENQVHFWNESCADGDVIATPAVWASIVRDMDPYYDGPRPKMQIYHGDEDTLLYPQNYNETCKQWAGVFGYDYHDVRKVEKNLPHKGYTTQTWGPKLQGIYAHDVGHVVPVAGREDMKFFGFT